MSSHITLQNHIKMSILSFVQMLSTKLKRMSCTAIQSLRDGSYVKVALDLQVMCRSLGMSL